MRGRVSMLVLAAILLSCAVGATSVLSTPKNDLPAAAPQPSVASPSPRFTPAPPEVVTALPEARYDAVIPGLARYDVTKPGISWHIITLRHDAVVYASDQTTPVAVLKQLNFLGEPTTTIAVTSRGPWSLVLTPARQELPSQRPASAPLPAAAQTAGWIRTDTINHQTPVSTRIEVSVSAHTLSIISPDGARQVFSAGIGTPQTPTPTGVTGLIQARYLDPAQGQATYPIQLTTLHATAADEPYAGSQGGLIGIHYQQVAQGAVSHGCIRLSESGITAVNQVPLGTPVSVVE